MLLITMTATSMLFAKIPRAHTPARAKPGNVRETDRPVMVRRGIVNQLKPGVHNLEEENFMYPCYVISSTIKLSMRNSGARI